LRRFSTAAPQPAAGHWTSRVDLANGHDDLRRPASRIVVFETRSCRLRGALHLTVPTDGFMMLVRLGFCVTMMTVALVSNSTAAAPDCSQEVSKLMSRDTEKLATRYQRIAKRMEKEKSPSLVAEGCRIARALGPQLEDQIAALKQSSCAKDPSTQAMITDIVRGYEDDLATMRKATGGTDCR
jgi:hypothetical protein